jgi:hypothetical protein
VLDAQLAEQLFEPLLAFLARELQRLEDREDVVSTESFRKIDGSWER